MKKKVGNFRRVHQSRKLSDGRKEFVVKKGSVKKTDFVAFIELTESQSDHYSRRIDVDLRGTIARIAKKSILSKTTCDHKHGSARQALSYIDRGISAPAEWGRRI